MKYKIQKLLLVLRMLVKKIKISALIVEWMIIYKNLLTPKSLKKILKHYLD